MMDHETSNYPHHALAVRFLRTLFELGRVSNLPTVWTNTLTATVLSGATLAFWPSLWLVVGFSLFYTAGMFLNDAFDADIDRANKVERPIVANRIERTTVFVYGFAIMATGFVLLAGARLAAVDLQQVAHTNWSVAAVLLGALIVFYNWHHKNNPLSPLIMGLCRVMVLVTGSLVLVDKLSESVLIAAIMLLSYLIGLTYIAKQEGLKTVKQLWPVALLCLPILICSLRIPQSSLVLLPLILLSGLIALAVYLVRRGRPPDIPRAIGLLIAGICLVDAMLIAHKAEPLWVAAAIASFGLTLYLHRHIRGT